ncbi:MAG TPA: hypothetical protein VMV75_06305 [Sulfuricella sp.]|nr:hypothetical protein [Sulfuricella sp.]
MEPSKPERDTTAFQVRRAIPLADIPPEKLEQAIQTLRAIEWLDDVRVDGRRLRVRYDASGVNFRDIERLLDEAGLQRPTSLWWRFRSALNRFLDKNARSNALARGGACCSRPPSPWRGDDTPDSSS